MRRVLTFVSYVPIYGQLVNSSRDSFRAATKELFVVTFFSLFPFWFYPVVLKLGVGLPFWETLKSFVIRGVLYLYSAALLGPLVYAVNKTYGESAGRDGSDESDPEEHSFPEVWSIRFPYAGLFTVISIVVGSSAAFLFGVVRTGTPYPVTLELNEGYALVTSTGLYGFTLSCMFCVLVYRLNLEKSSGRFGDDTQELLDQWRDRN